MAQQQMRHYPAVLPTEAGEIVRLDKGLAKTHRLAVELFSGSGDEQGRQLQCWRLVGLTNRKNWRPHTASPAGTQKARNLVAARVMRSSSITLPPARE